MFDWVMKFFQEPIAVLRKSDYILLVTVGLEKNESFRLPSIE